MIKLNQDTVEPTSRKGLKDKIVKKIVIFVVVIIIFFTTFFVTNINSHKRIFYANIYTTDQVQQQNYVEDTINNYIKELQKEGYVNISYEDKLIIDKEYLQPRNIEEFSDKWLEKAILNNYIFYANYIEISEDKNTYVFKTTEESENFIIKINKYKKTSFQKKEIKDIIGKETPKSILDSAIKNKEIKAAEIERKKKMIAAQKKKTEKKVSKKEPEVQVSSSNELGSKIVNYAKQFNGNPYIMGGTSLTKGADCSGFTQSVFKHFGIKLSRVARDQAKVGKKVSFNALKPGDLVFYSGNGGKSITHVAIYIGNSKIIHAQTPKSGIGITSVNIMIKMTARRVI